MKKYQIIILTAGYGKRMRPLTYDTHKSLLEISGKTILQRIIDNLLELEQTDINIVTGYRAEELQAYLKEHYPSLNINYIFNDRYDQTNNIFSLALALESLSLNKDVILIESDLIFEAKVLKRLFGSPHRNVALLDRFRSGMDGTVVTLDLERGNITNVIPPHLQGSNFDFSDKFKTLNIYRFSLEFCQTKLKKLLNFYARAIDDNCYYELILGIFIYMQKEEIFAEILDTGEKWTEVDNPNDLNIAKFTFDPSSQKQILDQSFGGYWNYDILDFCFIRNQYFPTPAMISEFKNNFSSLMFNYGSTQTILNQKLATFLLCKHVKNLNLLNGASQIYPLLKEYFANKIAMLCSPSFGEYERIFERKIYYNDSVGVDVREISDNIQNCDLVVIVNPNNPTGTIISTDWIYQLAKSNTEKIFIIDESFIDFSAEQSILSLLEKNPSDNIILITSLSKTLGVPGLRLGYAYTFNEEFNHYLQSHIPIWNTNSFAEYLLEIILKYRDDLSNSFIQTKMDRDLFSGQLTEIALVEKVYPSQANFLLICLNCNKNRRLKIVEDLLQIHQIYVKDISHKFPSDKSFLRIAVRAPKDNDKFIRSFLQVIDL